MGHIIFVCKIQVYSLQNKLKSENSSFDSFLFQDDPPASTDMLLELKQQMAMMKESINNLIADNKALTERVNHLTLSQAEQRANNFISFTALATASRSYEVSFYRLIVNEGLL